MKRTDLALEARELWQEEYSDLRFHKFFLETGPADFSTLRELLFH